MAGIIISLNPAVDVEWRLPSVVPEEKNELTSETRWPGGKGINVARWLAWLGRPQRLFLPLGGSTGRELAAGLKAEKLRFSAFPLSQPNRANVVVTPGIGPQFRFNATWPRLGSTEARRLRDEAGSWVRRSDPIVISGTLAFGAPVSTYAHLVKLARQAGRRVFLDCDREPFARAAQEQPFLVKPNEYELGQWAGRTLSKQSEVVTAAEELSEVTRGWVLVSRGEAGAILVNTRERVGLQARIPAVTVRNTVGAGDALLAGTIAAVLAGKPVADWLADGVSIGTAATQVAPGRLPTQAQWRRIRREVVVTGIGGVGS